MVIAAVTKGNPHRGSRSLIHKYLKKENINTDRPTENSHFVLLQQQLQSYLTPTGSISIFHYGLDSEKITVFEKQPFMGSYFYISF